MQSRGADQINPNFANISLTSCDIFFTMFRATTRNFFMSFSSSYDHCVFWDGVATYGLKRVQITTIIACLFSLYSLLSIIQLCLNAKDRRVGGIFICKVTKNIKAMDKSCCVISADCCLFLLACLAAVFITAMSLGPVTESQNNGSAVTFSTQSSSLTRNCLVDIECTSIQ